MDKRILQLLKDARQQLELERQRRTSAIAIVGMGCRFPGGATSPESLWSLLRAGADATTDVPADRWDAEAFFDPDPDAPGKAYTKRGAFVAGIDEFDSSFFGIAPREALAMDPQQRLLLEVTWEAIEDAGIPLERLRGTRTGVWVGMCAEDYIGKTLLSGDPNTIDAYNTLGGMSSVAAGRLSYVLDLRGPNVQVDTACSSSLVAIHQACQSLRSGESNLAIVGGVNLMTAPEVTIAMCKLRALAPDGRCKTFDASADGYGRGEGCGVVILKRLDEALTAGDRIYAVVRGSAVNHDGHSNGLTAPSSLAQEAVIRSALADANIAASEVDYVETHGTGTLLGDPIEVLALSRVYGEKRSSAAPLYLGAVKANIGHLEGAAGIAGLIKVGMSLSGGELAPQRIQTLNPNIPWSELPVQVNLESRAWPDRGRPRLAAISAFGLSGTNAHVVLEEAPSVSSASGRTTRSSELVVISGKSRGALHAAAAKLKRHLEEHPDVQLADAAFSLLSTRSSFEHRFALAVSNRSVLLEALDAASREVAADSALLPEALGRIAFVFPGQGSQWLGMGCELLAEEAAFREAMLACDEVIKAEAGWSVVAELEATEADSQLSRVEIVQPVLFAIQVSLAALWKAWGVVPDIVVGHSMGEVAAACVTGALSLADGAAIICRRSRLLSRISGQGAMALVELSSELAQSALAGYESQLSVAVSNGPRSTVLSGHPGALNEVLQDLERKGVFCRRVNVDVASHSPQVDQLLAELRAALSTLSPHAGTIPMGSTVVERELSGEQLDASYWVDNLRQPVNFGTTITRLLQQGVTHLVEISPHPLLVTAMDLLKMEAGTAAVAVGSLRRHQPERRTLLESLGTLHVHGLALSAHKLFPAGGLRCALPLYAWQRERYRAEAQVARRQGRFGEQTAHPMLGVRISNPSADAVYESTLTEERPSWLSDHRVGSRVVVPAAAVAELVRAAVEDYTQGLPSELKSLTLLSPLIIAKAATLIQVVLTDGGKRAAVYARFATAPIQSAWTLHASAEFGQAEAVGLEQVDLAAINRRCTGSVDVAAVYDGLERVGIAYGSAFRGLRGIRRGAGEAIAELRLQLDSEGFAIHPALLDSAMQAMTAAFEGTFDAPLLPFELSGFRLHKQGATSALAHIRRLDHSANDGAAAEVTLLDHDGTVICQIKRVAMRPVDLSRGLRVDSGVRTEVFYRVEWQAAPANHTARQPSRGRFRLICPNDARPAAAWTQGTTWRGFPIEIVALESLQDLAPGDIVVCWFGGVEFRDAQDAASDALSTVQALLKASVAQPVWWVTRRAQPVHVSEDVDPIQSAIWGLGRTVLHEHPELKFRLIDLDGKADQPKVLSAEAEATDDATQVAWREDQRYVARLGYARSTTTVGDAYRLQTERPGTLDALRIVSSDRAVPSTGEIEVEVAAAGINFKDVLTVLGVTEEPLDSLGSECSGLVVRVGPGVEGFKPGDRVMALTRGAFGSFVTVDARLCAPVPAGVSLEQAAGIPVAFLTAWYALHDLGHLLRGERLLIHAAAGGVGMAAIQVARWLGAELAATAHPSKHALLRELGIEDLASSRDLAFAESLRPGVDVVLNSLVGPFVDASLSLLKAGGRFVEMGKADIRDPAEVADSHPGVSYRAFDLVGDAGVVRIAQMFADVVEGFEAGHLKPIPTRTFPIEASEDAFRLMSQGRHTGKLVLLVRREVSPYGTILITGGLGALGLEAARYFAERGVKHLVLTGRRGLDTPGAEQLVAELEAAGCHASVAAVDVADRDAMRELLERIPDDFPLRGVVHSAGVLADSTLLEETPERLSIVMAPKVTGAWNLHELTASLPLDFFVMFSSLAATIGSAGQAGYAAANAFLDGLAAHRRARGKAAMSIAWGPWSGQGLAGALKDVFKERLARSGIGSISPDEGRALFGDAIKRTESQLVVAPFDLRKVSTDHEGNIPQLWRSLIRPSAARGVVSAPYGNALAELPEVKQLAAVRDLVRGEVARVLSMASGSIRLEQPLRDMGLDSLMAVELRNAIGRKVGIPLPATLAFDYPTPERIARFLLSTVSGRPREIWAPAPAGQALGEPIAIVGLGCRFPGGANDSTSLWRLLESGADAVGEVPKARWDVDEWFDPDPDTAGKMSSRWGGFLEKLDEFEPSFFGISPREAMSTDPQERLLLETSWEALEHAGIRPDTLLDSRTGVYIGICGSEYHHRVIAQPESIDAYSVLGTLHSTIVGRLSYWLGLKGPNLPVDTACSSSLVAVHLACQALRNDECQLALAGGANVILSPESTVSLSKLGALSPSGRCRTFSSDADGFVRAEGAGVVVLERLSDARANGHRVLAVIRGSAVNQDGRSNGLTAPNGPSQQAVIREALERSGVAPADVGYVECHGTGTALGDPIEVQALGAALSVGRATGSPVVLGALKTNVGHMEGAAGVGGLIKTVLSMQHGVIPKSLHFREPNPHIPWSELPVKVASEALEWRRNGKARIAGVSSFGISGTNAHVVLEEAPETVEVEASPERSAELVVLSAKTVEALNAAAGRLAEHLGKHGDLRLGDVAYSEATTRSPMEQRLGVVATSVEGLKEALKEASSGETPKGAVRGQAGSSAGKLGWLFTGQGAQRLGMGKELYAEWAVFREALDEACGYLDEELERPLLEVMWAEAGSEAGKELDQTGYTQPALFAYEWALSRLWKSWGVEPEVLLGHSIGEITAACVAGVFSLKDAARLVGARSRLMQALPAGGAMVSIGAAEAEVTAAVAGYSERVSVAAINGPSSIVIAGVEADVRSIAESFAKRGVSTKRLSVSHAFHSPLMEPMLEEFRKVAESLEYGLAQVELIPNVSGRLSTGEVSTAEYWVRHVREAVRFADGVKSLSEAGVKTFLEIGPRATLLGLVPGAVGSSEVVLLASASSGKSEARGVLEALGGWYARGGSVEWKGVFPGGGRRVELPTYAWQRQRHWIEGGASGSRASGIATGHPLLGVKLPMAGGPSIYETVLSATEPSWLSGHRVGGQVVVPAAALMEVFRAAGEHQAEGAEREVRAMSLQAPLVLKEGEARRVQVVVGEDGSVVSAYSQASREPGSDWTLHATAELNEQGVLTRVELSELHERCTEAVDVEGMYESFGALGLEYGGTFRAVREVWRGAGEALAELELSGEEVEGYGAHPALLDAGLQVVMAVLGEPKEALLPFEVGEFAVHGRGASRAVVHVKVSEGTSEGGAAADVTLVDGRGVVLARVVGLKARRADVSRLTKTASAGSLEGQSLYQLAWQPAEKPVPAALSGRWLVVSEPSTAPAWSVETGLEAAGAMVQLTTTAEISGIARADHLLCVWHAEGASGAIAAAQAGLSLVKEAVRLRARLWWVTRAAVSVGGAERVSPAQSAVWGLGRTVIAEHPELGCTLIDIDSEATLADVLLLESSSSDGENQVAWRNADRHVARLVSAGDAQQQPVFLPAASTVLITGGLGALGREVATHFSERGVKHLMLTGRRGLETPGAAEAVRELEGLGVRVTVATVDVADRHGLERLLSEVPMEYPLRGVVHAAGLVDDGMLLEQTSERFERVMSPKVLGATNLDELTRGAELSFFVLFSSMAGTLGSAGQGSYAAGNAYLDGLASNRRAEGVPGQSLAWGPWAEGGMAASLGARLQARFARQGIGMLSAERGLSLLDSSLQRSESQLVVVPLDVKAASKALGSPVPPVWRVLLKGVGAGVSKGARGNWSRELSELTAEQRQSAVLEAVRGEVARVLSMKDGSQVPAERPMQELGLDSLMALELRNALSKRAGVTLSATLAFDYPTAQAITGYLLREVLAVEERVEVSPVWTAQASVDEPIAIVGMSCRYPGGVQDPESFWQLLVDGVDAIDEVPRERWDINAWYDPDPDARGKMSTRNGGFVRNVDLFDAPFFAISRREAQKLDPQQRLLLETSWEALEHAGIPPSTLVGTDAGIYVGLMYQDYANLIGGGEALDGYVSTGSAGSVASGRISYVLGLQGPSMTVDTACSSSLVTLHLACQALRARECSLALAGGVALMLTPNTFVEFSRLRGISSDGRCRTFSSDAAGTGWSEGCGMLVLERLSDARRHGHTVLALVRGSAVNQDGRSNGLTAPNGPSQQAVIREALRRAAVKPADVDYVECHGTATSLGDPVEVQALGVALSEARDQPVLVGSVKSNFGHTQAAAGVAGVIKTVLSMQHGVIPKSLHFREPNPHIPWSELPVKVASEALEWRRNGKARIAGVSSFGISGTNAHVVLEEAPETVEVEASPERSAELVVLSAKTVEALNAAAGRLAEHLGKHGDLRLGDVAYSEATTRSPMEQRLGVVATSVEGLKEALKEASSGETPKGAVRGQAGSSAGKLGWLFTGQGAQRLGMGKELYAEWAVFREALDEACGYLDEELERPLLEVMWAEAGSEAGKELDQTGYTQPALFAYEWALSRLWKSWGVEPEVLLGHSIGEITAACVAGVFSLKDAARLVGARSRLMQALPAGGAMVSIGAAEAEVTAAVAGYSERVSVAAINGPSSIVIAGVEADVRSIAESFAKRGVSTKRLSVSHAFHSPLMEPMLEEFRKVAESLEYGLAQVELIPNVSGRLSTGEVSTAEYWVRHVREAVRFADGVKSLSEAGVKTFLEIGPRATLLGLVPGAVGSSEVVLLASASSGKSEARGVLEALGGWYARGGSVEWKGVFPGGGRRVELPTYAWQRQRHWIEGRTPTMPAPRASHGQTSGMDQPLPVQALQNGHTVMRVRHPQTVRCIVEEEVTLALSLAATDALPLQRRLLDLGLDSVKALELRSGLNGRLGVPIPADLALDQETVQGIIARLARATEPATATTATNDPSQASGATTSGNAYTPESKQSLGGVAALVPRAAHCELLFRAANPRGSIVCFHDAGGSSAMFARFEPLAAVGVDVHCISHVRTSVPGSTRARDYLSQAAAYIAGLSKQPCFVFGHSLGAALAWRAIQELIASDLPLPAAYLPSACPSNTCVDQSATISANDVIGALARQTGRVADSFASLRRDLEADIGLWSDMPARDPLLLPIPIAAFAGNGDELVSESKVREWAQSTSRDFSLSVLPGGHFYPHSDPSGSLLVDLLTEFILAQLRAAKATQRNAARRQSTTYFS